MKLRERNTVLGKQEEAFKTETGMDATYKIKSSVYHSLVFCKWQASKIATLQAENEWRKVMSNLTPRKAFEAKTGEDAYGNDLWGTAGVNPSYVKFLEDDWSAHDKLKQRISDAPKVITKKGNGIFGEHVELNIDTNINNLTGDYALVELEQEES
jgi:hypothetical protein